MDVEFSDDDEVDIVDCVSDVDEFQSSSTITIWRRAAEEEEAVEEEAFVVLPFPLVFRINGNVLFAVDSAGLLSVVDIFK